MLNKKKNYNHDSFKYIQCVVEKVIVKIGLINKFEIIASNIKCLKIKETECKLAKITRSDFSGSVWKETDLTNVKMDRCEIEGLRINGYLISELIRQQKEISHAVMDDEMQSPQ